MSFKKKSHILFSILSILGAFLFVMFVLVSIKLFPNISLFFKSARGDLISACDCAGVVSLVNEPTRFLFFGIISVAVSVFVLWFLCKAFLLWFKTNGFVQAHKASRSSHLSRELKRAAAYGRVPLRFIREFISNKPLVYVAGFLAPKLFISSALVETLSQDELSAVLRHEDQHRRVYEPLRLFIVKAISGMFFFIPGLRSLTAQYMTLSELMADEFATCGFANRKPLAQALSKVMHWHERDLLRQHFSLSFFGTITDERVNALIEKKPRVNLNVLTPRFCSGLLIVGLTTLLFYLTLFSKISVFAQNENQCYPQLHDLAGKCNMSQATWVCSLNPNTGVCGA